MSVNCRPNFILIGKTENVLTERLIGNLGSCKYELDFIYDTNL